MGCKIPAEARPSTTPYFRDQNGDILRDSIAEIKFLPLGGAMQWVMIRGESRYKPLLIHLHGGPGFPGTGISRRFNSALERDFTVVYWEQRGTGRSFDPSISASSMTIERFVRDLDELVDYLKQHLGQTRVALYGHSWGSALGILYASRFPEKVSTYIGTGQLADLSASESRSYRFVLAEARRRRASRAIRQLENVGPPPFSPEALFVERRWLFRFLGPPGGMTWFEYFRAVLSGPEVSPFDLPGIIRGQLFSIRTMWSELAELNLLVSVPALEMPVFFFLGRQDHVAAPDIAEAYLLRLRAPEKYLVWFEKSGHEPAVDEAPKFNALMREKVLRSVVGANRQQEAHK